MSKISKRSRLLKEALEFINLDDWGYYEDFMVFGETAFQRTYGRPDQVSRSTGGDEEICRQISAEGTRVRGSLLSEEKTRVSERLHQPSRTTRILKLLGGLTPKGLEKLLEKVEEVQHSGIKLDAQDAPSDDDIEALDQHYSEEILQKLDDLIHRVGKLPKIHVNRIPNKKVQIYFEKAHQCYLYGFKAACAVMCRAILESSLKEIVDPDGYIQQRIEKGKESYPLKMVENAITTCKLKEYTFDWAKTIKNAGDNAVHNIQNFERNYSDEKIEEGLFQCKEILIKLYRN